MRPQSLICQQSTVDINSLSLEELRAYINGLRERREALITERCEGGGCSQCAQRRFCDRRLKAD